MARRRSPSKRDDLFDLLVRNALDFLDQSVSELPKQPKYSLIHFCSALELFLKARLMAEHWSMIVAKPENASLVKFRDGEFRSVTIEEAINRLRNVADEPISRDEEMCFGAVRDHRNKVVHFFHERYVTSPPNDEAISEVASEQCKAWFFLHRLLSGRWALLFEAYAKEIERLNEKMQKNRVFLKAKYEAITPEIKTEIAAGAVYERCASCGFDAARVQERAEPLFEAVCRICRADRSFLRVPCPECGETIIVEDMGEAECPNECFQTDVEWLIEQYGPDEDPKEESELAYCTYCERTDTPSAIPFGDFEYLCLSCLGVHQSAGNCGWCHELNASLAKGSYLGGCVMCSGKFGSDSFLRE